MFLINFSLFFRDERSKLQSGLKAAVMDIIDKLF